MIILSKMLSETDIRRRCTVPMKYFRMEGFPRPRLSLEGNPWVDFDVKDESGRHWSLRCSIRDIGDDSGRPKHPKPVLIKEWIPFVKSKELCAGDRVIIYEEQDKTGSMRHRIKVEKRTSPSETRRSPFRDQNPNGNKSSTNHNSSNESTVIFHHPEDHSADVLNHELGQTTATTTFSIDKEHITTTHCTSQDIAGYTRKRPRLSLSLELTLEPTTTGGMTAATSSSMDKKRTPTFHSHSQDIGCYNIETPSLNMNLGLTLKPTSMQEKEPTTIDFLRFL
ncbi:hypothetical protein HRI_005065600 [Hibiscus trionum]|uniref:TF-B3 domain-containing protein n=1 Tax=Hibiscus trionum TaxID=183268 RepID=A0A9W7JL39_HIBTR|nr:hypothetical protein HRI_005065600 [Hibiscus trionum]